MKNVLYLLVLLVIVSIAVSCKCSKNQKAKPAETAAAPAMLQSFSGKVTDIQNGKDGYTATIVADDQKIYYATVSHSNLKDPAQYRTINKGETLSLKGDFWKMDDQNRITVRELDAAAVDSTICYEGKLVVRGICKQRVVSVLTPNTKLALEATWKSDDGKTYNNVFNVKNICGFPDTIKEGDTFTFHVVASKRSDCAVCLAYVPVPETSLFIEVGCEKK